MSQLRSMLLALFILSGHLLNSAVTTHMYEQLMLQLLKTVNIEEPSEQELRLINACRAHSEGGLKQPHISTENWQAINSIEMFKSILPLYSRNITISGYIALARQVAQMTDQSAILKQRVTLTQHLKQEHGVVKKMNTILTNAKHSEHAFFNLFRQINSEEQTELNRIHGQLYFDPVWYRPNLEILNENATALEFFPRLQQLISASTCIFPVLIGSYLNNLNNITENILSHTQKKNSLWQELGPILSLSPEMDKEITHQAYEQFNQIQDKRNRLDQAIDLERSKETLYHLKSQAFDKLQNDLKQKDPKDLSNNDYIILNAKTFHELYWTTYETENQGIAEQFEPSLKAKTAGILYDSIRNLPCATSDLCKTLYKHATGSPVYDAVKQIHLDLGKDEKKATEIATVENRIFYASAAYLTACYSIMLYTAYDGTKKFLDLIYEKQQDLIAAGQLIKSLQLMHKVIDSDATLQELMSTEHTKLGELFDKNSNHTSADLKNLVNLLLSSSFQSNSSYLLSKQGKILATHHLLNRIKAELVPYLEAFGQIDAYLAITKLYQEFQNHPRVHFCLPEFIDAKTPILDAQEYWHPLIDTNKVVVNTLAMNQQKAANLIITGPNAGGKTTALMSLIINIIFAQSWGIAPSSSLQLTPFAKIHSYLDITTNLQDGLSLFAAEVDRAKKLKASIMACTPEQKTFTIIDEIFSGTDPKVASDIGFNFAAQLGEMAHSMTIITTHFPALTKLEEENKHYVNYKVADATIHEDGTITYPFKLISGISSQNIAAQMLHNQGII